MFSAMLVGKLDRLLEKRSRTGCGDPPVDTPRDIDPIEKDLADGRVVEASQQAHERRLSGPGSTFQSGSRRGRHMKRDASQHRRVGRVAEADVSELDIADRSASATRAFGESATIGGLIE